MTIYKNKNFVAIKIEDLWFSYEDSPVIENVGFVIPYGGITVIIGPNGSGKTTLLKIMLGLLKPSKGSIAVLGIAPDQSRKQVGYVPQRFTFDKTFPITVFEFLKFICPKCSDKKIISHLSHLNIEKLVSMPIGSLSGGQLQRVLIVRAILHQPKILFLDEPVSGIDIEGERSFYEIIAYLHKKHKLTIVMVSHEINVVYNIADQVICLNKNLVCQGPPQSLTPDILQKLFNEKATIFGHKEH